MTPVYHATPGVVPAGVEEAELGPYASAVPLPPPERVDTVDVVPPDVAGFFHTSYGLDVTRVPVHRGPEVTRLATTFGARAFTRGAQVFLPSEAGDLSGSDTKALLAHELVHVAQQQFHGVGLPEVASPEGQGLEAVAVATEQWFRGERAAPPALIHRPAPEQEIAEEVRRLKDELTGIAEAAPAASVQQADVDGGQDFVDLIRQEVAANHALAPASSLPQMAPPSEAFVPADVPANGHELASWSLADSSATDRDAPSGAAQRPVATPPVQASLLDSPAWHATQARIDALHGAIDELSAKADERAVDLEDPRRLDELAGKLYRSVRSRLRTELIVDSERAGMLSNFERS